MLTTQCDKSPNSWADAELLKHKGGSAAGTHGRGAGESKEVFTGEVKYEEVSVNYALELETKRQT